jgi:hypothetical protein
MKCASEKRIRVAFACVVSFFLIQTAYVLEFSWKSVGISIVFDIILLVIGYSVSFLFVVFIKLFHDLYVHLGRPMMWAGSAGALLLSLYYFLLVFSEQPSIKDFPVFLDTHFFPHPSIFCTGITAAFWRSLKR